MEFEHPRPPVEWVARAISDPVLRLKFLKATAPSTIALDGAGPGRKRRAGLRIAVSALICTAILLPVVALRGAAGVAQSRPLRTATVTAPVAPIADIWQVENTGDSEAYSNGLRIESDGAISTHARSYLAFPAAAGAAERRSQPAGIVFHTTESLIVPFEARENSVLKKIGSSLLDYVRHKHCYHFLIDRFGRVYRVVAETDAADHAGYSVWADDQWRYVNLNESFIGVSFETETHPGQTEADISPAQARSAAMLTEMLRAKYRIPAANCVTHGQVSVNPSNMRAGYHTDWASGFPYEQVGLPDNYRQPLPALWAFGFEADPAYLDTGGERIGAGVEAAENILRKKSAERGESEKAYRKSLQRAYREALAEVRR